jgi:hypothetical protein
MTYSYSLRLDLSFDTHIDELQLIFQNVNKPRRLFTSIKHKQMINSTQKTQDCVFGSSEVIHQVSKDLTHRRPNDP